VRLPVDLHALWQRALAWYNGYSPRDRRIILGILVAAGLSLVYIGVVEPILDYRKAVGKQIADGQEELERSMRFVGAKDTMRAEREELRKRLGQAKTRLLPGGTGTLGAAALQERAHALASEKGISVQSTQVMKEEALEPFRKVAVRLTLSGELGPLAELVSGLEYAQQLSIPFFEVSRRGAVSGAKGPRTLSATVEVTGFVQGGTPGKTEAAETEGAAAPEGAAAAEGAGEGAPAGTEGQAPTPPAADVVMPPAAGPPGAAAPPASGPPITVAPSEAGAPSTIVPFTLPPMVIPTPTIPPTVPPPAEPPPTAPEPSDSDEDEG
jgi:type II secretory pathway component PulM